MGKQIEVELDEYIQELIDEDELIHLGKRYLNKKNKNKRSEEVQLKALKKSLYNKISAAYVGNIKTTLRHLISDDYKAKRTTTVNKWMLSKTEVKLAAIVAIGKQ